MFQWDSMITTLPGLYWISVGVLKAVSLIFTADETCPVIHLRTINVLFATGNFGLLWKLMDVLEDRHDMVIKSDISVKDQMQRFFYLLK